MKTRSTKSSRGRELNRISSIWGGPSGKLSLLGRCGLAYFGPGNLRYHLGEEDKPLWGPVECRTCNYTETGTTSAAPARITSIMSVETRHDLKLLGDVKKVLRSNNDRAEFLFRIEQSIITLCYFRALVSLTNYFLRQIEPVVVVERTFSLCFYLFLKYLSNRAQLRMRALCAAVCSKLSVFTCTYCR